MAKLTYFDGLSFPWFGINKKSRASTDTHPLFYGLQYIHSGSFYLSVNGGKRHLLKGPLAFLTSPDVVFCYGSPPNVTREHYFVCFEGERIEDFLNKGLFVPAHQSEKPYISPAAPDAFLSGMLDLILCLQNKKNRDMAVVKLETLLLQLQQYSPRDLFCGARYPEIEQIMQQIMIAPEKEWNFTQTAENMNITLKHFRRLFQHFCGMPPQRFVLHQRILKASAMLITELDAVKTIAYQCGFNNEFYFSRLFKKYMGVSPEHYRNKYPYTTGPYKKNNPSK